MAVHTFIRRRAADLRARPRLADDLPGAVGLAASGAVGALRLAVDDDRRLVLAAILALRILVGVLRHAVAVVAVVRVVPTGVLPVRLALERVQFGLAGILPILLVQRAADLIADQATDEDTGGGRRELAAAVTDLRADEAADTGARRRSDDFLVAVAVGAGAGTERGREQERCAQACNSHDYRPLRCCK